MVDRIKTYIRPIKISGGRRKEIGAAFTCKECGKSYKFVKGLQKHMQQHKLGLGLNTGAEHQIGVGATKQEGLDLDSSVESLDLGVAVRLPCDYCDKTFSRKDKVTAHLRKVHPEVQVKRIDETSGPGSKNNGEKLAAERTYTCDACPKDFKKSKHLYRHKSSVHSDVVISCDECGKHFSRRDKLNAHTKNVH